jgi:hypothetical protein
MGTSAGPSLQGIGRGGDSNLVLEMDAHDAKSYPGEPTSNIFYNPNNWTGSDWTSSSGTIANNAAEGPNGGSAGSITAVSADPYIYSGAVHSVAVGSFTFSCWVKGVGSSVGKSGDMRVNFSVGTATGSDPAYVNYTLTDQWQRVSILATATGAGTIQVGLEPPNSAAVGDVVYLADAQLEQKGYATPFVREGKGGTGTYNARPASVNLMIHGDVGTGQTFSDSSPSKHTITANGNTTHSSAQSKFSGGSVYFDGSGDRLTVPSHADFGFGTGSFTVDCWVYKIATVTWETFVDTYSYVNNGFICGLKDNNSTIAFYSEGGTGWNYAGGTALALNTWYHLAWVRDGNNFRMFVDGVQQGSTFTFSASDNYAAGSLLIGSRSAANYINGYMDEVRVTKGTALWTSAFTPPTRRNLSAPVVDRSSHDNGGNFATTDMTDVSTYRVGEVIRPIDSAVWDFDGTDDAISIKTDAFDLKCFTVAIKQGGVHAGPFPAAPGQVNVGMNIGTGGFNGIIMGSWTGTMDDETLSLWGYNSTPSTGSSATYIKDEIKVGWHIFTFNWNGSDYDIWVDGTKRITFARGGGSGHSGLLSGVTAIYPGRSLGWSTDYFEGNIGFFRAYDKSLSDQQIIENFYAKRNSLNIANWSNRDIVQSGLEMWLDAGISESYPGSGTTWSDISGNGYNGTITGATYSGEGQGSLDFNGTTDKVDVSTSTWGAGSFCISMWFKGALPVNYQMLFGTTISTWITHGSGTAQLYVGSTLSADTWYNLVFQRDYGVAFNWYLNGQNIHNYSSNYLTTDLSSPNSTIAKHYNSTAYNFDGNIATTDIYTRALSASEIEQNFIVQRQRFGV